MATTVFGSNPYGSFKEVTPEWTECEVCERKLKTRDWTAHKNSKKHRENEKNASIPGSATYQPGLRGGDRDGILKTVTFGVTSTETEVAESNRFTQGMYCYTVTISSTGASRPAVLDWLDSFTSYNIHLRSPARKVWTTKEVSTSTITTSRLSGISFEPVKTQASYVCVHSEADILIDNFGNDSSDMASGACYKCGGFGHMARDCSLGGARSGCFNCGGEGHISRDCPEPRQGGGKQCYNCNETGHMSKDRPLKQGGGGGGRACYNCGGTDHISRDCTAPRQSGGGGGGRACYNCGGIDHISRDCTAPKNPNARPPRRDFSNMKCHNCGESKHNCPCDFGDLCCTWLSNWKSVGHPSYKCTNEPANNGGDSGSWDNADNSGGATGGWDNSANDNAGGDSSWDAGNNDSSWN